MFFYSASITRGDEKKVAEPEDASFKLLTKIPLPESIRIQEGTQIFVLKKSKHGQVIS